MSHTVLGTWAMTRFSKHSKSAGKSSRIFLGDPEFQAYIDIFLAACKGYGAVAGLFSSFDNQRQQKENIILKQDVGFVPTVLSPNSFKI